MITKPSVNPLFWLLPLAFLLGLGSGYLIWGAKTTAPDQATLSLIDDDPSLGPEDAPIVVVEFSDYQCPYCQLWHQAVFPQLMATYEGKIRFIYRDFPLSGHPEAIPAATAANCAGEQGAYWRFHDALFSMSYGLSNEAYHRYAADLGLDTGTFAQCLQEGNARKEVLADYQSALGLGVQSTPTFFINGISIIGAQPFEVFQQVIEAELQKKE